MGTWQHWVNAVLGLWVLAVPFFFGIADTSLMWTLVISGLVIAALGVWGATDTQSERSESRRLAHNR